MLHTSVHLYGAFELRLGQSLRWDLGYSVYVDSCKHFYIARLYWDPVKEKLLSEHVQEARGKLSALKRSLSMFCGCLPHVPVAAIFRVNEEHPGFSCRLGGMLTEDFRAPSYG